MFCMALCLALSAQITAAMLDRLQHVLDIDHAASALAGEVVADLSDHADHHDHGVAHHHDHDSDVDNTDHGGASHHHQDDGMLAPWLTSVSFVVAPVHSAWAVAPHRLLAHPDAAQRLRERPPKESLGSYV